MAIKVIALTKRKERERERARSTRELQRRSDEVYERDSGEKRRRKKKVRNESAALPADVSHEFGATWTKSSN